MDYVKKRAELYRSGATRLDALAASFAQ